VPRFSIVITCFNQDGFIGQAVESALAQRCEDREVIVVDDASTDGSSTQLAALADRIRVETFTTNAGVDCARNHGASVARGDYLVFLVGDDRLLPWALDVYGRAVDRYRPLLILATLHFFAGDLPPAATHEAAQMRVLVHEDYLRKDRPYRASASAMVVDRRAFERVGGWTIGSFPADDQDLLLKLGTMGPAVQILAPATCGYRMHDHNATASVDQLVVSCHRLLCRERRGEYPGGPERAGDRHAILGGFLLFLVGRTFRAHRYRLGGRLIVAGRREAIAALARRCIRAVRRRRPETIL
jgi:glycosyltransferase involved in cell wall biosynthesis